MRTLPGVVALPLALCTAGLLAACERRVQVSNSTQQVDGLQGGGTGSWTHSSLPFATANTNAIAAAPSEAVRQPLTPTGPGAAAPALNAPPPPAAPPVAALAARAGIGSGGGAGFDGDTEGAADGLARDGTRARGTARPAYIIRPGANGIVTNQARQDPSAALRTLEEIPAPRGGGGYAGRTSGASAAAQLALAPSPAPEVPRDRGPVAALDPNGRFATTYRPGGGHLAAFEAAVSSGTVPANARDLVGALGARYAPDLAAPTGTQGALAMRVDLERTALPPSGGPLRLRIALRSSETAPRARPPMSVHLVWDSSGSMTGASMDNARAAARTLVEHLQPTDTFSLVRFSDTAEVLVHQGPIGPRRGQVLHTIDGVEPGGGTNIQRGLELGYLEAARGPQAPDVVQLVMLMSDGRATEGDTNRNHLVALAAQAFQRTVQTSTFGLGTDYDGALMASLADYGAGGYYYLPDTAHIAQALTAELDARVQPVAQALELRVRLRPEVTLTQTYGSRRLTVAEAAQVRAQEVAIDQHVATRDRIAANRQTDNDEGMRFFIPGFARADQHVVLLGLSLPAGVGERPLGTVELRYKDRLSNRNVTQELPLRVRWADSDAASLATLDPSVVRTVQGFEAGETLQTAARSIEAGHRDAAFAMLNERASLLRGLAQRMNEPRFNEDAARLTRFSVLTQGASTMSDPLVLAMLLDTSGRGLMH